MQKKANKKENKKGKRDRKGNMKAKGKIKPESKTEINLEYKKQLVNGNMNAAPTFCVAMLKNGNITKIEGKIEDFLHVINDSDFAWVNIQVSDLDREASEVSSKLGFSPSLISDLVSQRFSGYNDLIAELGLMLPSVRVHKLDVEVNKLVILIKSNMIVTIHGEHVTRFVKFARYAVTFFKKIPKKTNNIDKISLALIRILDENNERNFDGIRSIQEQGELISKYLIETTGLRQNLGTDIYKMKHALISYLEALWASLDVIHYLRYGDAELITDDPIILRKVSMLSTDLTRQISISEQLSSVLASGLEVLQSIYNNQLTVLNNRLSLLAVWIAILGTAFIVPNTIATVFGTPIGEHLGWRTMLLVILISTILSVLIVYWFVKKRGILPPRVE
ncbi:magnesium transporter CorA [Candidatus Woesearchaeota archaeon]|nr:magnesium transporter CorA [Candidatus Woesearchaeota archaeon]